MFLSCRCELAEGTARTTLHLTVTSNKANYLCSLPYFSQMLRTTPQMSGSSPDSAFSKAWMSLNPGAFLRTIHKSNKNDSIRCHKWSFKGTFSVEIWKYKGSRWSIPVCTDAGMLKQRAGHAHKVVWVIPPQEICTKYTNMPRFSFIAASYHTQAKPQAVPRVSFLVPSLHSVCSEKSHCLPYTAKSSMAELTATTLRSQPSSHRNLQQISCPCWCLLPAADSCSLLNTLLAHHIPPEPSLAIPTESPGSMNLARWDTYLQEAFSIFSTACLQLLWTRTIEKPCRIRSYLVTFVRG